MGNNARFDQPQMALAAYEAWMALEECEKYRLISSERSALMARAMALMPGVPISTIIKPWDECSSLEKQEDVMAVMTRVGDDHISKMIGTDMRVVTLEEQEDEMHEMALEQYEKCLEIQIEASRIKLIAPWIPTSYMADLAKANLDVAKTFNKIAVIYKTQKKYELAMYNFKKCLAIQIKYVGAINMDVPENREALLARLENNMDVRENNMDVRDTKLHIAEVRTFMHRGVVRATAAVLRRATRAEGRAARAMDRSIQRARNFALRHPELF
jgi:tetratricopeptide (TPR) repeat protein